MIDRADAFCRVLRRTTGAYLATLALIAIAVRASGYDGVGVTGAPFFRPAVSVYLACSVMNVLVMTFR